MTRAELFERDDWRLAVIGLGYVGLPFAVNAVARGITTIGFDIDHAKVEQMRSGHSPVDDVPDSELQAAIADGLKLTAAPSAIKGVDAYVICVPSPLGARREPDLTYIRSATAIVVDAVEPGGLVVLESTTYPGTTDDVIATALRDAGYVIDEDVSVAFSPERVDPGRATPIHQIPKVIGGVSPKSTRVAVTAYEHLVDDVHPVSSARVAEFSKLLENTYRSINIAMANEMAQLAHEMGVSIWETIDAAATKPFGFTPFYPGPGVGGHCIPLDPQYLAWKAKEVGGAIRFVDLAEQINSRMPRYVVERATQLLNDQAKPVRGSRIMAIGLSYKRDVSDDRESPAVEVAERLKELGAEIEIIDPTLTEEAIIARGFKPATDALFCDLALILTDHSDVDYESICATSFDVLDTRGVYRRHGIEARNVTEI